MTFYEKYKSRLQWGWFFILITVPLLGLLILIWDDELIEMLNEIKVEDSDGKEH